MNPDLEHGRAGPTIAIPRQALVDAPVPIRLRGLAPAQQVTIRATMRDARGDEWQSSAVFQADAQGEIDLATQAALRGTYTGIDPMGLFWSMLRQPPGSAAGLFAQHGLVSTPMEFVATAGDTILATATIERLFVGPQVVRRPLQEPGLVGVFCHPAAGGPHPGILVLGGSSGGLPEEMAYLLASHGYAALALAYFAVADLPAELVQIPLEYFERAIGWMQSHPAIQPDRLAVFGRSRGGELALLLGSMFPQLKAVVGFAASGFTHQGWGKTGVVEQAAWTYRGVALPFLEEATAASLEDPMWESVAIPVERAQGPILLVSGQDDDMWPAAVMSDLVIQRLARHQYPYPYQHLSYAGAGHRIWVPYLPTTVTQMEHPVTKTILPLGGNAKDSAFAAADSWSRVLRFLADSLHTP